MGKRKGDAQEKNEAWRWDEEVQNAVKNKKKVYKAIKEGSADIHEYKKWKKEAKRTVAKAKEKAWKEWYEKLETKEGEDQI